MFKTLALIVLAQPGLNPMGWGLNPGRSGGSFLGSEVPVSCPQGHVAYDVKGVLGCAMTSDTAPTPFSIAPSPAYPGGTQTAANIGIFAGQDETKVAIDDWSQCAGAVVSVWYTVATNPAVYSTLTLTEGGGDWTAATDNATTCASLAASSKWATAGMTATCTSPNVLLAMKHGTVRVRLTESVAACTTVATGTTGSIEVSSASFNMRNGAGTATVNMNASNGFHWDAAGGGYFFGTVNSTVTGSGSDTLVLNHADDAVSGNPFAKNAFALGFNDGGNSSMYLMSSNGVLAAGGGTGVAFASLPAAAACIGCVVWCTNCDAASTPCTSTPGSGAWAFRVAGPAWNCPF